MCGKLVIVGNFGGMLEMFMEGVIGFIIDCLLFEVICVVLLEVLNNFKK